MIYLFPKKQINLTNDLLITNYRLKSKGFVATTIYIYIFQKHGIKLLRNDAITLTARSSIKKRRVDLSRATSMVSNEKGTFFPSASRRPAP